MYSSDFIEKVYFAFDKFDYAAADDMLKKLLMNLIDCSNHRIYPLEDGRICVIIPQYKKVIFFGKIS